MKNREIGNGSRPDTVKPGLEVLLDKNMQLLKDKRVGLVTNPTAVSRHLVHAVDILFQMPGVNLTALYGPQHGIRGNAQSGEYVPFHRDKKHNLPVYSLYGQSRIFSEVLKENIDLNMRSFDVTDEGKIPEKDMLSQVDILLFDVQDVGTRIYTYIATMAYCMQVCAEIGSEFMVLDRPNPINGITQEGPLLDYPEFSSFVGLYPVPVRHALTAGELARLFNSEYLMSPSRLTVIPMEGWRRHMWFDQTGLPWISPSPNMPSLNTAVVYPGQVFMEGTNISEGRGTTKPFELFGAPWIDGTDTADALNELNLPGVRFRETWFRPGFSKYAGELCGGAQIHVLDRERFRPFVTALHIIKTVRRLYPKFFQFHKTYFDTIMGKAEIREMIEQNGGIEEIEAGFQGEHDKFIKKREPYLLYD